LAAAERIVGGIGAGTRAAAARRFVDAADKLGMDLSRLWGTVGPGPTEVREVVLAVVGSGRTAMLFVSGAEELGVREDDPSSSRQERAALLDEACEHLRALRSERGDQSVVLAQALLEPEETEAMEALGAAGFLRLGDLAYLRRPIPRSGGGGSVRWPAGVSLRRMADTPADMSLLCKALDRTYEQTMDCPELCGLRDVGDVLESHRSVGVFDPGMWWLILDGVEPEGCMLLSVCPEQSSVELVYLGLSPRLRGKGLGGQLLMLGVQSLTGRGEKTLTCAVDTRNVPAMALYRRCGFHRFATRVPFVRSLRA
jgi:ribosomal protein S18 acetylase RimI-like enzyme